MNAKYIIIKYLKENGFDGLCYVDCGCRIDNLIPCGNDPSTCVPGYVLPGSPLVVDDLCGKRGNFTE